MNFPALSLALTFGAALLTGCATSAKYTLDPTQGISPPSIKFVDNRNEEQKRSEVMSMSITDCWYGVYRLGDEQTEPGRLSYLAKSLDSRMGDELAGKTVRIDTFEVFNNWQSVLRPSSDPTGAAYGLAQPTTGAAVVGNALGAGIAAAIMSGACRANSSKLAVDRNPNNLPAVIVNYDFTVDSRRVKGTVVQLEPQGIDSTNRGAFVSERVKRAMSSAVDAVASELKTKP